MADSNGRQRVTTRQESLERKEHLGDETPAPSHGGVAGGALNEKIGSRDEEKRAFQRPSSVTRVRKSDEKEAEE